MKPLEEIASLRDDRDGQQVPRASAASAVHQAERRGDGASATQPASYAQERMWLVDRLRPGSAAYNIACGWRLRGHADIGALEQALNDVMRRHSALRTRFLETDKGLFQEAVPGRLKVVVSDLRQLPVAARSARRELLRNQAAGSAFDLREPTLLRASLLQVADDEYDLLLVMHHIASDGWSVGILARELGHAYSARVHGTVPNWPELPVDYAGFAHRQRESMQGESLSRNLRFWRERLQGLVPLDMPTDWRRPPIQGDHGARVLFQLPTELEARLKSLALQHRVTLYMLLLAAFQVLLARYSGQVDIAVGSPVSGRNSKDTEGLIGFFANTVVMRGDLSGNPTFSDLLARTRNHVLDALDHQDFPFEKLVEDLQLERDLSRHPLVQVVFALQNAPSSALSLEGLICERETVSNATSKFDLLLSVTPGDDGLSGSIEYDVDLFAEGTIQLMSRQLAVLLTAVTADPTQPILKIPLLSSDERLLLTHRWSGTQIDYPRDATVHGLFEATAARCPDAQALLSDKGVLTYAELDQQANLLAVRLRSRGEMHGSIVALLLDRSPELIVAMLAVLKSGAIYMPLDPGHPGSRLQIQIRDSAARLVVTSTMLRVQCIDDAVEILCVDDADLPQDPLETRSVPIPASADSPAAIMYTSGSTGQPKGTAVTHRNIVRLVRGTDYVPFGPDRTFLFNAPAVFDASTFEIWGALLNGGRCAIMTEQKPSLVSLGHAIERFEVDTLWLTASLFNAVIDERPAMLSTVSWLVTGGEALSVPHVRRALESLPSTRIVNGYGPTETTTFACCHAIEETLSDNVLSIPIGRPIANTRCYVLDEFRQLSPIGTPGELYIGGDGVASGYLNRPDLTSERFIRIPLHREGMLYRTGDRVRWRHDGTLEFLGRTDEQIKLRGFRIEPGEIAATIMELPEVQQVHVMLREDRPGDRRLVAYLVGEHVLIDHVGEHLAHRLPEFMRPASLVLLPAMPITATGKVDRHALPAPESPIAPRTTSQVLPRTPTENRIHTIWKHVLERGDFGVHDNFFALGGHSLLAARATLRASEALNFDIPLRMLFEHPTVARLSGRLDELSLGMEGAAGTEVSEPEASAPQTTDALVTIVRQDQGQGWVLCVGGHILESLKALPENIGILYLGSGAFDPLQFHRFGINGAFRRYVKAIRHLHITGPLVTIGFSYGGLVAYSLAAKLRKVHRSSVDCVLLEPSTPTSRLKPLRLLIAKGAGFFERVFRQGPTVLVDAVRKRIRKPVETTSASGEPEPVSEADREWNRISPQLIRNVRLYRPPGTPSTGVHLLVGNYWIEHQLGRFQRRFTAHPTVHALGGAEHHDVVDRIDCIQRFRELIVRIIRDRAAEAS